MKEPQSTQSRGTQRPLRRLSAAALVFCVVSGVLADPVPTFRFAVIGDHRGDNKAWDTITWTRYTDDGITKPALKEIASALKTENVDFVLDVGDLATKWTKQLKNITPDVLFAGELADWANLWREHSGNLPIFPVRGNQEVSASVSVWQDFVKGMPGIGSLPPNGPAGEEWMTYSFTYRNCLFVGVDQYMPPGDNDTHYITPAALEWVDQQLDPRVNKLTRSGHKFVWGHAPAFEIWDLKAKTNFTTMKDGLASPYTSFSYDFKGINFVAMRDTFWDSVAKRKAEYFCGHDHIYARGVAVDSKGRWARQTIIGNGGAPPPILPPAYPSAAYTLGPFAESYTGIPFATLPTDILYQLESPRIIAESFPLFEIPPSPPKVTGLPYGYGYVVIEVAGPKVTAIYKAEPEVGAGFREVDRWTISAGE